jgi:riboflavin kinase/FMN adenylyltransferase
MIFEGIVIQGLQNGRKLGFPTANVLLNKDSSDLKDGVYAVKVTVKGQSLNGMLYVGNRPTFHLSQKSIEIYLFDFHEDIYNQKLNFQIIKKIRESEKFDSINELVVQIKKDQEEISAILLSSDL